MDLILSEEDPKWVKYPSAYILLLSNNKDQFFPWYLLPKEKIEFWSHYLYKTYNRRLFPFSRKDGTDDFACWEENFGQEVKIIHTFTDPGWEQRDIFKNFDEWYAWALSQKED